MFEAIDNAFRSKIFWISATIFVIYLYFKIKVYSYWRNHGIPHDVPTLPFGTLGKDFILQKIGFGERLRNGYEKFRKYPYHGVYLFHIPALVVHDPEIIKYVLVKEFASFADRRTSDAEIVEPLSKHLLFITGRKWKTMRKNVSPIFTPTKLKPMYELLQETADELTNIINETLEKTDVLELKDLVTNYTVDTIFTLAFGLNAHCLRNPNNEFRFYSGLAVQKNPVAIMLNFFAPVIMNFFKIPFNNPRVTKFFVELFEGIVKKRKMDKTNRNDVLNLLIELMEHSKIKDQDGYADKAETNHLKKMELEDVVGQAYMFFAAGFDTTSSVIIHTLYELALNPDEQEKVHQEIDELLEFHESFNYDNISQLEYLKMSFYEAMRKHSSASFLTRICLRDCALPNSDYVVPKGMNVIIPVTGLNYDPDIYPDPEKFDPTRFSKDNIAARHPFAYLPFGDGPRYCIGKRLGIMMVTAALASLLSKFKFSVCEKTAIPNRYKPNSLIQSPRDGVYLRVEKRNVKH